MPRLKFIENKFIQPPYISVDVSFSEYGEEKKVPERIAIKLLKTLPYAFSSKDINIEDTIESDDGKVEIRFLRNDYLDSYTDINVTFAEPGDKQMVSPDVAAHLLEVHHDKFELVAEAEKKKEDVGEIESPSNLLAEVPVEDNEAEYNRVLAAVGPNKLRISEIAEKLDTEWQTIRPIIKKMVDDNRLVVTEEITDNGQSAKMYSVVN